MAIELNEAVASKDAFKEDSWTYFTNKKYLIMLRNTKWESIRHSLEVFEFEIKGKKLKLFSHYFKEKTKDKFIESLIKDGFCEILEKEVELIYGKRK